MINVVFEGSTGTGKTTTIGEIKKIYEKKKYKVGITNDIDKNSPLYEVIKEMFESNALVSLKENFNTLRYETLIQAADYLYLREKLYSENNDINLFDRNYASVFSYQSVLLDKNITDSDQFMKSVLTCMKSGEKPIDLMIFFDIDIKDSMKRSEKRDNRKFSKEEKQTFKKFNEKLKDFIRYNNSDYKLLIINQTDTKEKIIEKITHKIDEILDDRKKEDDKWYELYKVDIEDFKKPDDYFKYKLKYKKKFINKVLKYAKNKKVLEAGCGTALMAGYLQKKGLNVTALDLSQEVLDYAKSIAENSKVIMQCSKYQRGDILNLKYKKNEFDVSYSNGVLEHFNDVDIINTLRQQMQISKYVIFGIPSTYFNMNEKMLGNERGLTLKEWKNLIEQSGGELIEQTSFHYYKFYRRLFEVKKWFKPKAFWLFVLKEKD